MSTEEVANEAGLKNRMGGFANPLKELYFLVALAGKVQVLHGCRGEPPSGSTSNTWNGGNGRFTCAPELQNWDLSRGRA